MIILYTWQGKQRWTTAGYAEQKKEPHFLYAIVRLLASTEETKLTEEGNMQIKKKKPEVWERSVHVLHLRSACVI